MEERRPRWKRAEGGRGEARAALKRQKEEKAEEGP